MPGPYATVGTASAAVRARRPWRTRRPPIGLNQATSHGRRTLTGDKPSATSGKPSVATTWPSAPVWSEPSMPPYRRVERSIGAGGGGANAVHFAPLCEEFIAVDVAAELAECARQVAASATPP